MRALGRPAARSCPSPTRNGGFPAIARTRYTFAKWEREKRKQEKRARKLERKRGTEGGASDDEEVDGARAEDDGDPGEPTGPRHPDAEDDAPSGR